MPMPAKQIAGKTFNSLTAVEIVGKRNKANLWRCVCVCGGETTAIATNLLKGVKKSCGCQNGGPRKPRPDLSKRNKENSTHGHTGTRTYNSWRSMLDRCCNSNCKDYPAYGGRGIFVFDEWKLSFQAFLRDMGERPPETTLDRIDVNGPYTPQNTRWAKKEVQNNNKRMNLYVEYGGETKTCTEWARVFGIEPKTLRYRILSGWETEAALKTPSTIRRK